MGLGSCLQFQASNEILQAHLRQTEAGQPLIPEEGHEQKDTFCEEAKASLFRAEQEHLSQATTPGAGNLCCLARRPSLFSDPSLPLHFEA